MTQEQKIKSLDDIARAVDEATSVEELKEQIAKVVAILREDAASDDFKHLTSV